MSRAGRWSLALLFAALVVLGLLRPDARRELETTSFGTVPAGYKALFDLLSEVPVPVARSYAPPDALPPGATVWWIEPNGVCRGPDVEGPPPPEDADRQPWRGGEWIAAGGTAVMFLSPEERTPCASIAGVTVPARSTAAGGDAGAEQADAPSPPSLESAATRQVVTGDVAPRPRVIEGQALATFDAANGGTVVAGIEPRPFALAYAVGAGRLVLVADARFLRNQWLDRGDAPVLAMDLVRAYGAPHVDEWSHGLHRERHPLRYLLRSAALPALAGVLILGVLFVWHGQLLPEQTLEVALPPAPTLAAFVDSLARLYAGTGDYAAVLGRYRRLTAARLRRHFGLPPETPLRALTDRLRARRRVCDADLARLEDGGATVDGARDLEREVRRLDALVREAMR